MARKPPKSDPAPTEPPSDFPSTPPRMPEHSFTFQAAFEIHASVGELKAKVERITTDLAKIGDKVARLEKLVLVTGTTIVVALAVSGFWLRDKFGDLIDAIARVGTK